MFFHFSHHFPIFFSFFPWHSHGPGLVAEESWMNPDGPGGGPIPLWTCRWDSGTSVIGRKTICMLDIWWCNSVTWKSGKKMGLKRARNCLKPTFKCWNHFSNFRNQLYDISFSKVIELKPKNQIASFLMARVVENIITEKEIGRFSAAKNMGRTLVKMTGGFHSHGATPIAGWFG